MLQEAIPFITENPARYLSLRGKGELREGADADVLVLTKDSLAVQVVMSKGELLKNSGWQKQPMFSQK